MAKSVNQRVKEHGQRVRNKREKQTQAMGGKVLTDSLRESVQMMKDAGLPMPTEEDIALESAPDRASTVARIIGAATKAVELARRRGELITAEEHEQQMVRFASMLRQCISQMDAFLPNDIDPDIRTICSETMKKATRSALNELSKV